MAFVQDNIPKEEMHLFDNWHFMNLKGEPMMNRTRAMDRERNMFLVHPGGGRKE